MYAYLSWTMPSVSGSGSITSFRVYRGTTANGESPMAIAEVAGTTYNDTGLTNGQKYFYKVRTVNSIGESLNSSETSATPTPPGSPPSEPRNLAAIAGYRYIKLNWNVPLSDGNSTIIGYKIYRSLFSGNEIYLTQVAGTTYNNTNLENGTTYFYRVAAVNALGTGSMSDEASATTLDHQPSAGPIIGSTGGFDLFGFFSDSVVLLVLVLIAGAIIFWFVRENRKSKARAKQDAERLKKSAKSAALKKGPGIK
jgi:fibronectin type 3 domain-containing protein